MINITRSFILLAAVIAIAVIWVFNSPLTIRILATLGWFFTVINTLNWKENK